MMPQPSNNTSRVYSTVFSILIFGLLLSFVSLSKFNLNTIATNFRWRKELINFYSSLRLNLGDKIYNKAVIGKNGWIFFTGDSSMADYQNAEPLKSGKLARLQKSLDQLNKKLKKQGITLLVVIPPNKSTIYPQIMPEQIPVIGNASRLDQLLEYMRDYGDTFVVDLRPTLLEASKTQDVYYKTDTHWNDVGAYYGYVEIMNRLALDNPLFVPRPISDYKYTYIGDSVRDIPLLMGFSNYKEKNWALIPNFEIQLNETRKALPDGQRFIRSVINSNNQLPALLVFGDSFYGSLAHFVEPHFSRVRSIPFTYDNQVWSLDWIDQEKPNIVIIEIVERDLDIGLPVLVIK